MTDDYGNFEQDMDDAIEERRPATPQSQRRRCSAASAPLWPSTHAVDGR